MGLTLGNLFEYNFGMIIIDISDLKDGYIWHMEGLQRQNVAIIS